MREGRGGRGLWVVEGLSSAREGRGCKRGCKGTHQERGKGDM